MRSRGQSLWNQKLEVGHVASQHGAFFFFFLEIRKWIYPYGLSWSSFKLQWILTETKLSGTKNVWLKILNVLMEKFMLTWRKGLQSMLIICLHRAGNSFAFQIVFHFLNLTWEISLNAVDIHKTKVKSSSNQNQKPPSFTAMIKSKQTRIQFSLIPK